MLNLLPEPVKRHLRFIPRLIRNQFSARLEVDYYDNLYCKILNRVLAPVRKLRRRELGQVDRQNEVIAALLAHLAQYQRNIVLVNSYFPPNDFGGSTRVITQQVHYLKKHYGNEVGIWVIAAAPTRLRPYEIALEYVDEVDSVAVLLVGTALHPRPEWFYFDKRIESLCSRIFDEVKPDLLHAHSVQRLTAAPLVAAKALDIAYIITLHDAWWINDEQFRIRADGQIIDKIGTSERALSLYKNRQKAVERLDFLKEILLDAALLLSVSNFQRQLYQLNGINSQLHENGVAPFDPPVSKKPSEKIRFLYAGGLASHKGYDVLKDAFCGLSLENWRGTIVDLSNMKSGTTCWGASLVEYRPAIKQRQWRAIYEELDVVIIPSIVDESFGLLAREALSAACAVIVSDSGALAECVDIGINGWVVKKGCVKSLQEGLRQANEYLPLNFALSTRIKTDDDNGRELVKLYQSL